MNDRASSAISLRPTAGVPLLTSNAAPGEKNVATAAGSWLHQAAVYRAAKSLILAVSVCMGPYRTKRDDDRLTSDSTIVTSIVVNGVIAHNRPEKAMTGSAVPPKVPNNDSLQEGQKPE
jgi:hypothetical protein